MATKRHVAFTWGKSVAESIKMSSLEFEQNDKNEDNSSKFGILNVNEDSGTEVKDREEQDGGYFDAMMEHNTEESAESIDSFMKKTTEKNEEGMESEIRHTEKNNSVEGTHVYGSEEDSSYNINEEIEKESRVMDCESADIALNDISMGLSLQDNSEGEGDDIMVSEETGDDMLSDKIADDGMASDEENVIDCKGDVITGDEENYVMACEGREGNELLTGGADDMIDAEGGIVDVMVGEGGRGDDAVTGEVEGGDDLMAGEGADLESVISGGVEGSGSLLDKEYVDKKKEIKFVKTSNIQMKVNVLDKRVGEAADLVSVVSKESGGSGALPDTEYLDRKQIDIKKETAIVKTSHVHMKVDVLDKTVHIDNPDIKDKMTKSDQQMENIEKSKENKVILRGEAVNIDLKNEDIKGIAATSYDDDNDNPDFQDMLTSEDLRYNERCIESENGEEAKESLKKMEVLQVNILGIKKEMVEATSDITMCDEYNEDNAKDKVKGNKMNDILKEEVNTAECEDDVGKHKAKTAEEARRDRGDTEERTTMGTRDNVKATVEESRNVAQLDEDEMVQTKVVKEEGKIRLMSRNQDKDLESDKCVDLDKSSKKASRTQIRVVNKDETEVDIHEISDTQELVSTDQQPVGSVLVKKTVSNIERVKRKIEEILEKSKAEEDAFIAEIQQMKKEKTDILNKISSEMKKLKSLLVHENQEEQGK